MPNIKVGQSYQFALNGSDGSTLPPGGAAVTADNPSIVNVTVRPDNTGTVTGIASGSAIVTASCAGYIAGAESVSVSPKPSIVWLDSPPTS